MQLPGIAPAVHALPRESKITRMFPAEMLGQLTNGVFEAVLRSFQNQGLKPSLQTMDEKRRRFNLCMDWAMLLRGDLKWGVQRIVDAMSEILKADREGTKWEPPVRQCWIPGDGR